MTTSQEVSLPGNNPRSLGVSVDATSILIFDLVLGAFRALRLIFCSIMELPLISRWLEVDIKVRLDTGCFLTDSVIAVAAAIVAVVVVEALVKKQRHEERDVRMVRGKWTERVDILSS